MVNSGMIFWDDNGIMMEITEIQLVGLREKLQEAQIFHRKIDGFLFRFSLKSTHGKKSVETNLPGLVMTNMACRKIAIEIVYLAIKHGENP